MDVASGAFLSPFAQKLFAGPKSREEKQLQPRFTASAQYSFIRLRMGNNQLHFALHAGSFIGI